MRLEARPHDPIPGVIVTKVDGSITTVGIMRFLPGPPATLSWAENAEKGDFGQAVDVSAGGTFQLAAGGTRLTARVQAAALPPPEGGQLDEKVLIWPTMRSCFHFDVRNIPLAATGEVAAGRPGAGWNNLQVYLGSVPQSSPRGYLIFDLATVPVRFIPPDRKTPDRPFITLDQFSFVLLEGTP